MRAQLSREPALQAYMYQIIYQWDTGSSNILPTRDLWGGTAAADDQDTCRSVEGTAGVDIVEEDSHNLKQRSSIHNTIIGSGIIGTTNQKNNLDWSRTLINSPCGGGCCG